MKGDGVGVGEQVSGSGRGEPVAVAGPVSQGVAGVEEQFSKSGRGEPVFAAGARSTLAENCLCHALRLQCRAARRSLLLAAGWVEKIPDINGAYGRIKKFHYADRAVLPDSLGCPAFGRVWVEMNCR